MARMARFKIQDQEAFYHLYAHVAAAKDQFDLDKPLARKHLIDLLARYSQAYFCQVAAFCVMGNHWHAVVRFEAPREVEPEELKRRAAILYPSPAMRASMDAWPEARWQRLRERLFDVSELMRNVQSAFARWYNRTYQRRGRFWGDRFKSTYLENLQAVADCMLYVELNPVRAGLVERPEDWSGSSFHLRHLGRDRWLMPLTALAGAPQGRSEALREYRERLYYRGSVPTKAGQARISEGVLAAEQARGFTTPGAYRRQWRYFVDGVAIGTEAFLREQLARLRREGRYLRRRHPIRQADGIWLTLREQRRRAVVF